MIAASRWSVRKAAQGMVWTLYGIVNGPQDMVLHIPFAGAGSAAGGATGLSWLATKAFARRVKNGQEPMTSLSLH